LIGGREMKRLAWVGQRSPSVRVGVLLLLWLLGGAVYYVLLVQPYRLLDHLAIPRLSLGVMTHRQPQAAAGFLLCFALAFALYAVAYRTSQNWRSVRAAAAVLVLGALTASLLPWAYAIWSGWRGPRANQLQAETPGI
jgi:hypothetical protein